MIGLNVAEVLCGLLISNNDRLTMAIHGAMDFPFSFYFFFLNVCQLPTLYMCQYTNIVKTIVLTKSPAIICPQVSTHSCRGSIDIKDNWVICILVSTLHPYFSPILPIHLPIYSGAYCKMWLSIILMLYAIVKLICLRACVFNLHV